MRDQLLCDLLHVFEVTLRTYKPLQLADTQAQSKEGACACEPEQPCSCALAAGLKLTHLQADAQVRSFPPGCKNEYMSSIECSTVPVMPTLCIFEALLAAEAQQLKGSLYSCRCRCCEMSSTL